MSKCKGVQIREEEKEEENSHGKASSDDDEQQRRETTIRLVIYNFLNYLLFVKLIIAMMIHSIV